MKIEFVDDVPIYKQIIDALIQEIARGKLAPGDRLPSMKEFAEQSKVNPNTVQKAYIELERSGVVISKRGEGRYVTDDVNVLKDVRRKTAEGLVDSFLKQLMGLGYSRDEIIFMLENSMGKTRV